MRFAGIRLGLAIALPLAVVAGVAWLTAPREAQAHAILLSADPPVNAQLLDPPPSVTGFFSEPLDTRLSSLQVVDGTGEQVDSGETTFGPDPAQMSVDIAEELEPGFYTVLWETLSTVDGHLLKGSFPFTVLNPDGSEPEGPRFEADAGYGGELEPERMIPRWLGLVAAVMLAGGLAFVAWVVRPASKESEGRWKRDVRDAAYRNLRRFAWPAVALLAIFGLAEILLQARQLGGLQYLDETLDTFWGQRWLQRQIVLVGIGVALFVAFRMRGAGRDRPAEAAVWVALAGAGAYLLLVAMVSHAGAVAGSFWAVGGNFIHLVAAAVWIGALVQLGLLMFWSRSNMPEDERAVADAAHLQRFSVLAATSVVLLLASGGVNGLTHIASWDSLTGTSYGRAVVAKLALVGVLLVVAGANAFYLRPRAIDEEAGTDRLRRRLSTLIRAEVGVAVLVLLVSAALVQYPPARQQEAAAAAAEQTSPEAVVGFEEIRDVGDVVVNVAVSPGTVGNNSFRVFLFPPAGETDYGEVLRVRLRFIPPDPDLGEAEVIAEEFARNGYRAVGAFFSQPGDWDLIVDIRRRGLDDVAAEFPVTVRAAGPEAAGGQFAYPLSVGSWATVGALGLLIGGLLMGIWGSGWPDLPRVAPRLLRVSSAAVMVVGAGFLGVSLLPDGRPVAGDPESIAMGRTLYMQNCASCHGETGAGDGPLADSLDVPPADFRIHVPYHSDEFFYLVISNGLGAVMPAFGDQLSDDEIWHLIHYLKAEFGIDAQIEQ